MEKIRRVKRSEAVWRELFSRQAASGLPVSEFCRREGINAGLFRRWRAALEGSQPASEPSPVPPKQRQAKAVAPFIDLGALSSSDARPPSEIPQRRFEVRLELGAGMILTLVHS